MCPYATSDSHVCGRLLRLYRNSHATAQSLKTTNSGKLSNSKATSARRSTTFLCKEALRRKLSNVTVSNRSDIDFRPSVELSVSYFFSVTYYLFRFFCSVGRGVGTN